MHADNYTDTCSHDSLVLHCVLTHPAQCRHTGKTGVRDAMEAHYEGHYIHATAVPLPNNQWRSLAVLHWEAGRQGHLQKLRCHREFDAEADAVRIGFDGAVSWINEGKPEPFMWTTD